MRQYSVAVGVVVTNGRQICVAFDFCSKVNGTNVGNQDD